MLGLVGPLRKLKVVATGVSNEIPPHQAAVGPLEKVVRGCQGGGGQGGLRGGRG